MPSLTEFFLYFIASIITFVGYQGLTKNLKSKNESNVKTLETAMKYSPHIFWFRDYWSKRIKLGRNAKNEGTKKNPIEEGNPDLTIITKRNSKCTVRDSMTVKNYHSNLIDPYKFLKKYEPYAISPRTESATDREHEMRRPDYEYVDKVSLVRKGNFSFFYRIKSTIYRYYFIPGTLILIWTGSIYSRFLLGLIPPLKILYLPFIVVFSLIMLFSWNKIFPFSSAKVNDATATIYFYDGEKPEKHYTYNGDVPTWLKSKPYWVFLYIFVWEREFTINKKIPFIHFPRDQERVELWVDAKTGNIEWIVSDYHYRELWYKAEKGLNEVLVWVYPNFHTLKPLTIKVKTNENLRDLFWHGSDLYNRWKDFEKAHTIFHPVGWVRRKMGETKKSSSQYDVVSKTLSTLWWDHWRYPLGTDKAERDKNSGSKLTNVVGEAPPMPGTKALLGIVLEKSSSDFNNKDVIVKCQDGFDRLCVVERVSELRDSYFWVEYVLEGQFVLLEPDLSKPKEKGEIIGKYYYNDFKYFIEKKLIPQELVAFYELFNGDPEFHSHDSGWKKASDLMTKFYGFRSRQEIIKLKAEGKNKKGTLDKFDSKPLTENEEASLIPLLESAKEIFEKYNVTYRVADVNNAFGDLFSEYKEYGKAISYYEKALKTYDKLYQRKKADLVREKIEKISE